MSLSEVLWGFFFCIGKGDARTRDSKVGKRGQGNFKLAANFGYRSRGSADPRESLRKRRILKLALNAHKVFADLGVPCPSCVLADTRACLKNHFRDLQAPLCGIFYPYSVVEARYAALIRIKSPTNWDSQLTKSLFQTCSRKEEPGLLKKWEKRW